MILFAGRLFRYFMSIKVKYNWPREVPTNIDSKLIVDNKLFIMFV